VTGRTAVAAALGLMLLLGACDATGQLDPGLLTSVGTIRAQNLIFEPEAITLRAGTPVTITFENADDGVPHGLRVSNGDQLIAEAELVTGPGRTTIEVPPLAPGTYAYTCPVHPTMGGTITVEP